MKDTSLIKKIIIGVIIGLAVIWLFAVALSFIPKPIKATTGYPISNRFIKSNKLLQAGTESATFVKDNELYYVFNDRTMNVSSTSLRVVKMIDASGTLVNTDVGGSFANGYAFQTAMYEGGTLYVFASKINNYLNNVGNGIYKMSSTDLTTWSTPVLIKTMPNDTQSANLSITKNTTTNLYVLAFEYRKTTDVSFGTGFLTSSDLNTWTQGGNNQGGSWQVSCPDLHYIDGAYYMWIGTEVAPEKFWNGSTFVDITIYAEYLMKSTDLLNWTISSRYTVFPDAGHSNDAEDFHWNGHSIKNITDSSSIEFQGKVYWLYSIGDQQTTHYLTWATYDGSFSDAMKVFYQ